MRMEMGLRDVKGLEEPLIDFSLVSVIVLLWTIGWILRFMIKWIVFGTIQYGVCM